jgi:hydroxymethylbilane synthase
VKRLIIGTRGSALARWQADHVAEKIREGFPELDPELRPIKTQGDKILDVPLAKVGGKGLFVKEIEEALLRGEVDLAVHSIKDVPVELPQGLILAAIPRREDPRDALIGPTGGLAALPDGARVGTSSLRRRCQVLHHRPDLQVLDLRGNVDTRLTKLATGCFDAIILAAAGMVRLGYASRITEFLPLEVSLPAVGQGALGIEIRIDNEEIRRVVEILHDEETARCVRAERALLARLGGGCQVPVAAHATREGHGLRLEGLIGHPSGTPLIRRWALGIDPEEIGRSLAEELLAAGGDRLLQDIDSS